MIIKIKSLFLKNLLLWLTNIPVGAAISITALRVTPWLFLLMIAWVYIYYLLIKKINGA